MTLGRKNTPLLSLKSIAAVGRSRLWWKLLSSWPLPLIKPPVSARKTFSLHVHFASKHQSLKAPGGIIKSSLTLSSSMGPAGTSRFRCLCHQEMLLLFMLSFCLHVNTQSLQENTVGEYLQTSINWKCQKAISCPELAFLLKLL